MKTVLFLTLVILFQAGSIAQPTQPVVTNLDEVLIKVEYPLEARVEGIEGNVELKVYVTAEGLVEKYEIISGCHPLLIASIESVVHELLFFPAHDADGEKIKGTITIPIEFQLDVG